MMPIQHRVFRTFVRSLVQLKIDKPQNPYNIVLEKFVSFCRDSFLIRILMG